MGELGSAETPSRKRKKKSEMETSEDVPEKKAKSFCCRTFRQELKGSEALKSLKRFISAAKNSDEVIFDYLEGGGSLQEILSLIDVTASGDLTTALPVFELVHLILLRFQSADSKYHERCIESARTILRSHMLTIKAMLSMNITKQKKAALKVMTAIATLDSSFANEMMNIVALSPPLIADLTRPSPEKESVRRCFVLFVLSFLVEGNLVTVKNLLDKKGFLGSIIPGLKFDEATTVNLTLSLFEEKIIKNVKIPKTLKLKLFNTQMIKSLFELYDWKGLQGVKQILPKKKNKVKEVEINQSEKEIVVESVHSFLLLLCCSQKFGVAFHDKSMGTSDQLNNQLLLTVFESLPDPLKNKKVSEVVLKTTASCPDIMKPLLLKLEPSFQPRNSKNWFQAMEFAEDLIKAMDATTMLKADPESSASHVIKVGKALCAPVVLLRVAKSGSLKSQPIEIQFRSLNLLTTIWGEIQKLLTSFPNFHAELRKSFHKHILKSLPDAADLVELWHALCDAEYFSSLPLKQEKKVSFLSAVLESLRVAVQCQNDAVASPLDLTTDLLRRVEVIKDGMTQKQFDDVQVKIVRFVELDLQSLRPKTELFDESLRVLLRSTDESSLSNLSKILASLEIFEKNRSEVDVWLFCFASLPTEHRHFIADLLLESIRVCCNGHAELKMDSEEEKGAGDETPSPLVFGCLEVVKSHPATKDEKSAAFRHFLSDLLIHLQHFYAIDACLHDHVEDAGKIVEKSCSNYLKNWKSGRIKSVEASVFTNPTEFELASWLLSDSDSLQSIRGKIEAERRNLLELFSLFGILVAYLTKKTASGELKESEVGKYAQVLTFFLSQPAEDDRESVDLISSDLTNKATYRRRCLDRLFGNRHLLKGFDVLDKKENHGTDVVVKVLMEGDAARGLETKKELSGPWKRRFLKQLKTKLKKRKSIDWSKKLETVLDYFEYDEEEVEEMVGLLVSDSDLFANGDEISGWVGVLSKFVKIHCQNGELEEGVVGNLCAITKRLSGGSAPSQDRMVECLVDLLRKHPSHLLMIENEFLDVVVSACGSSNGLLLGKLLLNDPDKVEHFLRSLRENPDGLEKPEIVFSLLSSLFVEENSFLDRIGESRSVWRMSEVNRATTPEVFEVLEAVCGKFEKKIVQAMAGDGSGGFFTNLRFAREIVRLFLDDKKLAKVKKEISKGKFEPELVFEAVKKLNDGPVTQKYLRGLLTIFSRVLPKDEDMDWARCCRIVADAIELGKDLDWKEIADSTEWKEFFKLSLGYCLTSGKHPALLKILRLLVETFSKSEDCRLFFQMLISHSQFLKVMLSRSPLKTELVELLHSLVVKSPSEASPKHFPIFLASYDASLSACDRTLLKVLRFYEKSGVGVSDYEPFVWGETAVSHYSIGTSPGLSLWQRFNMANVLDLLDGQRLEASLTEFPIRRSLDGTGADPESNVYDPAFLLPLFASLLSPGSVVFCLSFIYKGGLAYTVRALSSQCKDVRSAACLVLTRFYNHLEMSQNLKQKLVWMHFINCFRYGIEDLAKDPLPNISTLFLARMTLELSRQPAELYLPLQNFLLAKFYFSFESVPEFLPLFHSSEVSYWKHREWLLQVLRDGTKTASDVNLIFHSMVPKIIFCFFHSQLCDAETKKLILQVVERMLRIEKSILLVSEYGLLNWIASIDSGSFQPILHDLLILLSTLTGVVVKDIASHKSKHSNSSHLIQILNLAVRVLPSLKSRKSADCFYVFLRVVNECFERFVKEGKSDWFKINRHRLDEIVEAGAVVLGVDCGKITKVPFYFRDFSGESSCEDLKNCIFLFNLLVNRQVNNGNKNK